MNTEKLMQIDMLLATITVKGQDVMSLAAARQILKALYKEETDGE